MQEDFIMGGTNMSRSNDAFKHVELMLAEKRNPDEILDYIWRNTTILLTERGQKLYKEIKEMAK